MDSDEYRQNDGEMKRRRRSKNDTEAQSFKCDICGRSYLSKPAVAQHAKAKHPDIQIKSSRGRGRPKRDDTPSVHQEIKSTSNGREAFMSGYFNVPFRASTNETFEAIQEFGKALKELYNEYKEIIFTDQQNPLIKYPLLELKLEDNEIKTFDESILKYLHFVSKLTSKSYYLFICKFLILFREFVNIEKQKDESIVQPFSVYNPPESVPDLTNNFISDFLDENKLFGLNFEEIINLTQHYCGWLFDMGLTKSILTPIKYSSI